MVNAVNGIIQHPILLYWLLVRSTGEQGGSSRTELLSCLEGYKNMDYFCCVIPIKKIEQIYDTSQFNKTWEINRNIHLVLEIKFRGSKKHLELKVAIM